MIAGAQRRGVAVRWPRRAMATLGAATISTTRRLLLYLSLAATVLIVAMRRGTWRGPVWIEFKRVLHEVAVRSLPTTVATGLLVGFALVSQAVYWLAQTGTTGLVGQVIVILLIREFVPILVGLIVFGRSGTTTLIELGEAQTKGWLRLLEIQGLDPLALLVLPRAFGFALGAFCLATVLLLATLSTGYLVAHGLGLVAYSIWDFSDLVLRAMKVEDFILPPLKCITIGFAVALACCATGLGRRDEADELQRLVPRGFVRSALAILVVNSVFDLVA
jgi:phospholipid/cholesterol/gamma-HCH transport system permease protein